MNNSAKMSSPIPEAVNRKWLAMAGIGMGVFMGTLDGSIVNISLPTLVEQFHTNFATIQWIVLSYALMLTSMMLSIARLGDMIDKKKIYMTGLTLFTFSSLLCGMSPSVGWLIAFRALQGLGATMTSAIGIAIITEVFPPSERGRALGMMGGIVSVGIALGPALGGILIGLVGWRSIFLVNLPVGIVAVMVARNVPSSIPDHPNQRFDLVGAVILLVTLLCYALGMTWGQMMGFEETFTLILLTIAIMGLLLFLAVEMSVSEPMVDLRLFKNVLFGLNLLMGLLVFIVLSGMFIMPFFLQLVKHYPTQQVGLLMMVLPISMGLVAPGSGLLSDRFGSRGISVIGLLVIAVGCFSISTLNADTSLFGIILRLMPLGIGLGLFQSPNNSAIMGSVPRQRLGVASGLLSLSRTLGQTTGLPIMGAMFTAQVLLAGNLPAGTDITTAPTSALVSGITGTYHVAAIIILVAAAFSALALWIDSRRALES